MENTKKTKTMYFEELLEVVNAAVEDEDQKANLVDFIDKQLELINKRKVAAVERNAKKKAESDSLTSEIYDTIGNDLVTIDEIVVAFNNAEITRNKVTARLGKLFKEGLIEKEYVKVDGNKRMAYRRVAEAQTV